MNDLPRVATRQCGGQESNPRPVDRKPSALITAPTDHTINPLQIDDDADDDGDDFYAVKYRITTTLACGQ